MITDQDDILEWIALGNLINMGVPEKEDVVLDSEWVEPVCTCGTDSAGVGGKHSKWCEKSELVSKTNPKL